MDIKTLLRSNRQRRFRRQRGTVVERAGGWYLRFYTDGANGQRTKVSERLCGLDTKPSTREQLRRRRLAEVNAESHQERSALATELAIGSFWTEIYRPWAKENLRWSTMRGYEKLWSQVLEKELGTRPLAQYRTADGYSFLDGLKSRLNRNSLAHVRSLASGIFTHAVNLGKIDRNPWHELKSPKARAPRPKVAYTSAEVNAILGAIERTDAKLFFVLCALLGMRPSEAAGTRWEDVNAEQVHVQRAAPYGVPGDTKTLQSQRKLPLIEPVRSLIAAWRAECGGVTVGWLFSRRSRQPINHNEFVRKHIAPRAKAVCPRWCGIYSGRHGAATLLFDLTGDARAANQVLGNSLEVVMKTYIKPSTAAGEAGLKLLEAATTHGDLS
jgi:integrase